MSAGFSLFSTPRTPVTMMLDEVAKKALETYSRDCPAPRDATEKAHEFNLKGCTDLKTALQDATDPKAYTQVKIAAFHFLKIAFEYFAKTELQKPQVLNGFKAVKELFRTMCEQDDKFTAGAAELAIESELRPALFALIGIYMLRASMIRPHEFHMNSAFFDLALGAIAEYHPGYHTASEAGTKETLNRNLLVYLAEEKDEQYKSRASDVLAALPRTGIFSWLAGSSDLTSMLDKFSEKFTRWPAPPPAPRKPKSSASDDDTTADAGPDTAEPESTTDEVPRVVRIVKFLSSRNFSPLKPTTDLAETVVRTPSGFVTAHPYTGDTLVVGGAGTSAAGTSGPTAPPVLADDGKPRLARHSNQRYLVPTPTDHTPETPGS